MEQNVPIGYWLKKADNLLTERINQVQSANGVSRPEWQILNILHESGSADRERIFGVMRTFLDEPPADSILARLVEKGWLESQGDGFRLTEPGRQHHGEILAAQKGLREQAVRGISPEEYATAVRVLQRMVSNLE